ncbi:hypothetical protein BAY61_09865 [Prauserella marina]|nr:hypothetical protein BAY61_09865 [Prauserella marina]
MFEGFELPSAFLQLTFPAAGHSLPVLVGRRVIVRQTSEDVRHIGERDAKAFGDKDERDPAQHVSWIQALVRGGAFAGDQSLSFVEMQCGRGYPGTRDHLADGQRFGRVDVTDRT